MPLLKSNVNKSGFDVLSASGHHNYYIKPNNENEQFPVEPHLQLQLVIHLWLMSHFLLCLNSTWILDHVPRIGEDKCESQARWFLDVSKTQLFF